MKSKVIVIAVAVLAVLGPSGCSYAAMGPSEQGVKQNDPWTPGGTHNLTGCISPGETANTTFAKVKKFPARQIVWNATNDANKDVDPYVVISSPEATAQMSVPVSVTFDFTQNCDKLEKFYSEFAAGYNGFLDDNGNETQGWRNLINHVIGQPLQYTLNRVAMKYPWQKIWNDQTVVDEFRMELDKDLPQASRARTNNMEYFTNFQVSVGKPSPVNAALTAVIEEQQRNIQQALADQAKGVGAAKAAEAEAKAQETMADEQLKAEAAKALVQRAKISGFGSVQDYIDWVLADKGINIRQPQLVPGPVQQRGR